MSNDDPVTVGTLLWSLVVLVAVMVGGYCVENWGHLGVAPLAGGAVLIGVLLFRLWMGKPR